MEEWRQLESVSNRVEQQEYQVRSWLLVLLAALLAALYADQAKLDGATFSSDIRILAALMWREARIITFWGFYLPIWITVLILSEAAR